MNLNRRFLVLALTFAVLSGLSAQSVIDQLYGLRNYDLADAYWSAGQRFIDLGQADRGAEFQTKAKRLFPGFVPGQAPAATPAEVPSTSAPAQTQASAEAVREQNLQGQKIARLQFQKLLRGYLTGSAATVSAVLASNVEIQGESKAAVSSEVADFLQAHPTEAGSPDDLFLIDSLTLSDGPGQKVLVTVSPNPDANLQDLFPFWKDTQVYTFDRVGDTWKLVAVEGK